MTLLKRDKPYQTYADYLRRDCVIKLPVYERAGVKEVWLTAGPGITIDWDKLLANVY